MKKFVDIACAVGQRLSQLGRCDRSKGVIEHAMAANGWFSEHDIMRSVDAICTQMLDRDKLTEWLAAYPTLRSERPHRVAIIMAGNIPLVGLFDLICVLAAGHEAWIKPSSKDRVLIEYICELWREVDPSTPIYIYNDSLLYDAVIATGGEQANRHFEQRYATTKRLCRSNRHSIAVLRGDQSEEQMQLLAEDIYAYSGLGCRNVAMIFAPRGYLPQLPSYPTTQKYRNNYLQTKALLTLSGKSFGDNGSSLFVQSTELPHSLSTITIWEYDSIEQVEAWVAQHDEQLQCIVSECIDHPRRVTFGAAQRPTLHDYADGVDTMAFLLSL